MSENRDNRRGSSFGLDHFKKRMLLDIMTLPAIGLVTGTLGIVITVFMVMRWARATEVELPAMYGLMGLMVGLVYVLTCCIIIGTAIRVTNVIAGPVNRLTTLVEQVRKGAFNQRFNVRKKDDYLVEIAEEFNKLFECVDELRKTQGSKEITMEQDLEEVTKDYAGVCES